MTFIVAVSLLVEETKWLIRRRKSKDRQYNDQKIEDKRSNNDAQTLHTKLNIEQHELI